ncbi:MAG: hypothetical protein FH748_06275 [Balneolaceae bacterium]|nr:hypothetical protein [Balneolaceae bacterium]
MNLVRTFVLGLVLSAVVSSCSSTQKASTAVTEAVNEVDSVYPAWYKKAGFLAESTQYTAYHTAIAADSNKAISVAEDYARTKLESSLADKFETVRSQMASNGKSVAQQRDFIILLRNAHQQIVEEAQIQVSEASFDENHYRGFAAARISTSSLLKLMKKGFSQNAFYWKTFRTSRAYRAEFH